MIIKDNRRAFLKDCAEEALVALLCDIIRNDNDYDPDNGGPDMLAETLAASAIKSVIDLLSQFDPRGMAGAVR